LARLGLDRCKETPVDVELTDPAIELSELLHVLVGIAPTPKPTWMTVSATLNLDPTTEEYSDFCAAVLARVSGLRAIAQEVKGSQRTLERAAKVMSTADRLTHIFLPSGQAAGWADSVSRLSITDGVNLANFSPEARAARPLRLVGGEERDAFLAHVNEAIEEIDSSSSVDLWMKAALLREAKRLRATLEHIEFFGHEFAAERTAVLASKTAEALQRKSNGANWNLVKTYRLIMDLASAFIVVHDVNEAAQMYTGWLMPEAAAPHLPPGNDKQAPVVPGIPTTLPRSDNI
jgi:hypothetical protein